MLIFASMNKIPYIDLSPKPPSDPERQQRRLAAGLLGIVAAGTLVGGVKQLADNDREEPRVVGTYIVEPGENWTTIANKEGLIDEGEDPRDATGDLRAVNPGVDTLQPGDRINIPEDNE